MNNSKQKKCKNKDCANLFYPRSMSHTACCINCAVAIVDLKKSKEHKLQQKNENKIIKEKKEKLKSKSDYTKQAQQVFNRYIRLRAIRWGHTCISSGRPLIQSSLGGGFDAGHYRSVGSAPHLRFNMNNVWGQSKHDNRYGSGAAFEYRRGLILLRGIEVVEALESNNEIRKFDIEYLKRIISIFSKKAKRLEKIIGGINEKTI